MEAIVLAGGFGTRLAHIVKDVPKPMAQVSESPFLEYLLRYLSKQGIDHVILATGYKADVIERHFGDSFEGMSLKYSFEAKPLGTGGAIKKASLLCKESNIFVVNGDTFFDVDLRDMRYLHYKIGADLTIAVHEMHDFDRYGTIDIIFDDNSDKNSTGKVNTFREKQAVQKGWINGGVYLMKRNLTDKFITFGDVFSFEKDFIENHLSDCCIHAYICSNYFVDIGIPEDYYKANKYFKKKIL